MYVVLCMLGTMSYYGCPIRLPEALDGLEAILRSCSIYSTTLYHYYNCVQPKKTRCSQSSCSSSLNRIGARERELSLILLFFKIQLMTVFRQFFRRLSNRQSMIRILILYHVGQSEVNPSQMMLKRKILIAQLIFYPTSIFQ